MTGSEFVMLCCKGDKPGSICRNWATHVLVYINARTFQEITDKPKGYCYHHALELHVIMRDRHGVRSRIYPTWEWKERVLKFRAERDKKDKR